MKPYLVLAYYHFHLIDNPREEVKRHKAFFAGRDVACRIYISEQGINGQMSAARADATAYMEWMHARPEFASMPFKLHEHHELVFPKLTVKYRKQLVAFDEEVDLANRGQHVSPEEWDQLMENSKEKMILDVRNDYEWKIGHFEGAELPPCATFRDFRKYAEELKNRIDPRNTPVMMSCTGGIRCELYSAVLKSKGFEKVYQLDGGVINYGLKRGQKNWKGKLFVFDDRLAVALDEEKPPVPISNCHQCGEPNDKYYNCANMDCNALFLCCKECISTFQGCCQESCMHADRVRPYHEVNHKPFRKWYHYQKDES